MTLGEEFVQKHRGLVRHMMAQNGIPTNSPLAEDAEQTVWLGVVRAIGGFDPDKSAATTWLAWAAIRTAHRILKKERRARALLWRGAAEVDPMVRVPAPSKEEPEVDTRTLLEAVDTLPPKSRQALRMRFGLEGGRPMTLRAVALEMGVTSQCILNHTERGIRLLREALGATRSNG